jgi:hypothetical protein
MSTTPSTPSTPGSEYTAGEVAGSLTGFDEIAIRTHLGFDPYAVAEAQPMSYLRALVFVDQRRREHTSDAAARQAALELPARDLQDYFTEEPDEIDPDEPDTAVGKDG